MLLLLALPLGASADPGDHVAVGTATVTPGVDMGTEFRSNVYRLHTNEVAASAFLFRPRIAVENRNSDFVFLMSGSLSMRHYYFSQKSDNPAYEKSNLNRYNDTDATASLHLLPTNLIGVKVTEDFQNDNLNTESVWSDKAYISHLISDTSVDLSIHPGAALFVDVGGHLEANQYRGNPGATFAGNQIRLNNRLAYGPQIYGKWTFFPRTALIIDGGMEWFNWSENILNSLNASNRLAPEDNEIGDRLAVPDGREWRASASLIGRINNRLVINVSAGYGQIDYDEQSVLDRAAQLAGAEGIDEVDPSEGWGQDLKGLDGLLGTVQFTVAPLPQHNLTLGYSKDFEDSWFTNYLSYHYAFARYNALIASRWSVSLEGGYRFEDYVGEVERADHFVRTTGNLSYNANEWMNISFSGGWKRRASWAGHPSGALPTIEYDDFPVSLVFEMTY